MPVNDVAVDLASPSGDIPASLQMRQSRSYKSQLGVWCIASIEEGEIFGPFMGEKLKKLRSTSDAAYVWEIVDERTSKYLYSIDATNPKKSNWMRHVKCAQYFEDQNLVSVQRDGNIFYRAIREIKDGEELLVWYELVKTRKKKKKNETPSKKRNSDQVSGDKSSNASTPSNDTVADKTPVKANSDKKLVESPVRVTPNRKSKNIPSYNESMQMALMKIAENNVRIRQFETGGKVKGDNVKQGNVSETKEKKLNKVGKKQVAESTLTDDHEQQQDSTAESEKKIKLKNKGVDKKKKKKYNKVSSDAKGESLSKIAKITKPGKSVVLLPKKENKTAGAHLKAAKKDLVKSDSVPTEPEPEPSKSAEDSVLLLHPRPEKEYVFELKEHHAVTGRMGRKIFKCDICSAVYRQQFSIKRHYIRNHVNYRYLSETDLKNCNVTPRMVLTQLQRLKKHHDVSNESLTRGGNKVPVVNDTIDNQSANVGETKKVSVVNDVTASIDTNGIVLDTSAIGDNLASDDTNEKIIKVPEQIDSTEKVTLEAVTNPDKELENQEGVTSTDIVGDRLTADGENNETVEGKNDGVIKRDDELIKGEDGNTVKGEECEMVKMDCDVTKSDTGTIAPDKGPSGDVDFKGEGKMNEIESGEGEQKNGEGEEEMAITEGEKAIVEDKQVTENPMEEMLPVENTTSSIQVLGGDELDANNPSNMKEEQAVSEKTVDEKKHKTGVVALDISLLPEHEASNVVINAEKEVDPVLGSDNGKVKIPTDKGVEMLIKISGLDKVSPSKSLPGLFYCNICGDLFDTTTALKTHAQGHSKMEKEDVYEYSCSQCDMKFAQRQNLMRHSAVHTGVRPYLCQYCGKSFPTSRNQKRHEKIHLGERVYSCVYCDHTFSKSGHLKKHVRYTHPLLFHECKLCKKYFPNLGLLQEHLKTHDVAAWTAFNEKNATQEKVATDSVNGSDLDSSGRRKREATKRLFMDDDYNTSKNVDPASFKFSCTVCKKKFGTYANMCRHRVLQHERNGMVVGRRKPPPSERKNNANAIKRRRGGSAPQPTPEEKATFYANVAQGIASNLSYHLDGKRTSLDKCSMHIKSHDKLKTNMLLHYSNLDWQRYNLPGDFNTGKSLMHLVGDTVDKETEPPVLTRADQEDVDMETTSSRTSPPPLLSALTSEASMDSLDSSEPGKDNQDENEQIHNDFDDQGKQTRSDLTLESTDVSENKDESTEMKASLTGACGLRNVANIDLMEELSIVTHLPYRQVDHYICNVCQYEYFHFDDLMMHHQIDHPNVVSTYLELGSEENIPPLASPRPVGILNVQMNSYPIAAASKPSSYTCTKCEVIFADVSSLHSHIVSCAGGDRDLPQTFLPFGKPEDKTTRKHRISIKPLNAKHHTSSKKGDTIKPGTPLKQMNKAKIMSGSSKSFEGETPNKMQCINCARIFKSAAAAKTHQKYCIQRELLKKILSHKKPMKSQATVYLKEKQKKKPGPVKGGLKKYLCKHCKRVFIYLGAFNKHITESCPVLFDLGSSSKLKSKLETGAVNSPTKSDVETPSKSKKQNKENVHKVASESKTKKTYKNKPKIVLNPSTSDVIPILPMDNQAKPDKRKTKKRKRRSVPMVDDVLELTNEELIFLKIKGRKRTPIELTAENLLPVKSKAKQKKLKAAEQTPKKSPMKKSPQKDAVINTGKNTGSPKKVSDTAGAEGGKGKLKRKYSPSKESDSGTDVDVVGCVDEVPVKKAKSFGPCDKRLENLVDTLKKSINRKTPLSIKAVNKSSTKPTEEDNLVKIKSNGCVKNSSVISNGSPKKIKSETESGGSSRMNDSQPRKTPEKTDNTVVNGATPAKNSPQSKKRSPKSTTPEKTVQGNISNGAMPDTDFTQKQCKTLSL